MATDNRATVKIVTDSAFLLAVEVAVQGLPGPVRLSQDRFPKAGGPEPMRVTLPANGEVPVGAIDAYAEAVLTALAVAAVHDARVPADQRPHEVFVKFDVSFWNPDACESAPAAEAVAPAATVPPLLPIFYAMLDDAVAAVRDVEQMTAELLALPLPSKHALRVAAVEGILTTARRAVQLAINMLTVPPAKPPIQPPAASPNASPA